MPCTCTCTHAHAHEHAHEHAHAHAHAHAHEHDMQRGSKLAGRLGGGNRPVGEADLCVLTTYNLPVGEANLECVLHFEVRHHSGARQSFVVRDARAVRRRGGRACSRRCPGCNSMCPVLTALVVWGQCGGSVEGVWTRCACSVQRCTRGVLPVCTQSVRCV